MTGEKVTNALIYSTLQDVQARIGRVEHSLHILAGKLSSMDSHLAGFYQSLRIQHDEQDEQRGRIAGPIARRN